jgi:hypothetical protein
MAADNLSVTHFDDTVGAGRKIGVVRNGDDCLTSGSKVTKNAEYIFGVGPVQISLSVRRP